MVNSHIRLFLAGSLKILTVVCSSCWVIWVHHYADTAKCSLLLTVSSLQFNFRNPCWTAQILQLQKPMLSCPNSHYYSLTSENIDAAPTLCFRIFFRKSRMTLYIVERHVNVGGCTWIHILSVQKKDHIYGCSTCRMSLKSQHVRTMGCPSKGLTDSGHAIITTLVRWS